MAMVRRGLHIRFRKKVVQISASRVLLYIFIGALVCFTALPLIYVVVTAFKPIDELLKFPPQFIVKKPTLQSFKDLVVAASSSSVPFLRNVVNSIFIAVANVLLTIVVASMGAYSMAKMQLPLKKQIFSLVVAAMMFPATVLTIPTYMIVDGLGMINTYWALIVPKVAGAFNFFMMKQFCEQIPIPILEAARIDGATELRIFRSIVFPFLSPAIATLVVFSFTGIWNDGSGDLIYITNEAMRTLPTAISSIATGGLSRSGAMTAATFIMTTPTIIIYTLMQRRVIETMAHSGIK